MKDATPIKEFSPVDIEQIEETVLRYIDAWYEGDPQMGEKSLHPQLAKRIVRADGKTGRDHLEMMSASVLADRWRSGDGKATPKEKQRKDISILDIYGNMASVRLEASAWVDYMHLAKTDGKWVIVNILWELKR